MMMNLTLDDLGREVVWTRDGKSRTVTIVAFNPAVDDEVRVHIMRTGDAPFHRWVRISELSELGS